MGEYRLVVIASSAYVYQMQILKTFMEEHGVRAFLRDENTAQMHEAIAIGGAKLEVFHEDAERAVKLLRIFEQRGRQDALQAGRISVIANQDRNQLEMVDRDAEIEVLGTQAMRMERRCPSCHGSTLKGVPWTGLQLAGIFLCLGIPLFFMKPQLECETCGHIWAVGK